MSPTSASAIGSIVILAVSVSISAGTVTYTVTVTPTQTGNYVSETGAPLSTDVTLTAGTTTVDINAVIKASILDNVNYFNNTDITPTVLEADDPSSTEVKNKNITLKTIAGADATSFRDKLIFSYSTDTKGA